jgi:hypothetical protein
MRRFIFVSLLVFVACAMNAQTLVSGSFDYLRGQSNLGIILDTSEATIGGQLLKSYIGQKLADKENVQEWLQKSNAELTEELVQSFNKTMRKKGCKLQSIRVDTFDYQATVKAVSFTKKGDMDAVVYFTKTGSDEVLAKVSVKGDGGKFGSLNNLMGDGCKDVGKKLAKMLQGYLK